MWEIYYNYHFFFFVDVYVTHFKITKNGLILLPVVFLVLNNQSKNNKVIKKVLRTTPYYDYVILSVKFATISLQLTKPQVPLL